MSKHPELEKKIKEVREREMKRFLDSDTDRRLFMIFLKLRDIEDEMYTA